MTTKGYAFYKSEEYIEKMRKATMSGDKRIDKGYILIYAPKHPFRNAQNYVYEHRLVMEKKLGRYLEPQERIHHKNDIRNDNREENLKLFDGNSQHAKHHFPKGSYFGSNVVLVLS